MRWNWAFTRCLLLYRWLVYQMELVRLHEMHWLPGLFSVSFPVQELEVLEVRGGQGPVAAERKLQRTWQSSGKDDDGSQTRDA